jgi:hypothetical protein
MIDWIKSHSTDRKAFIITGDATRRSSIQNPDNIANPFGRETTSVPSIFHEKITILRPASENED